eukprot:scaffold680383_cov51-Attheya_sp.AAC.1
MDTCYPSKGIAFSPIDNNMPNFDYMLAHLSFDKENPPRGILNHLIESLSTDHADNTDRTPFLNVDNFMMNGPDAADLALLNSIYKCIRDKSIIAIVLTRNEISANFLLSQNNLEYIICPLVT